jgi:hypothetical protein
MIRDAVASLRARPGPDAWIETLFTLDQIARTVRTIGDGEMSGELAEQMRLHDPSYAGTHFAIGVDADRRGDRAAALRSYEEALRRWRDADPDLADAVYTRARVSTLRELR